MVAVDQLPPAVRALYPFSPQTWQTAAGARMSFLDEGPRAADAVVMLHGNPTWSFYYRDLVKRLSDTRRCVVPDHIGMGLSDKPEDYDYTLARRIEDVAGLVRSLGLKSIDLVVHDWGGAIGFGLAARMPALVRRIAILNTAAFAADWIPWRIAVCKLPGIGPGIVRGLNGFAGPATSMAMSRRALSPAEKQGYLFPYDSWNNRVAVSAFVRDIPLNPRHRSWETLSRVEQGLPQFCDRPVKIVWGGKDFCFDDRFLARWREIFPQADVQRLADAGHYVLEDARDEVVPELTRFLV